MKILFLQNKGKSYGGIWQVNKIVGEALVNDGFHVSIISIRDNHTGYEPSYDKRIYVDTLNKVDEWETYSYCEIFNELKKFHFTVFFKKLIHRLHNNHTLNLDRKKLHQFIFNMQPDYIVTSQYQLISMIPKEYLSKTYHENHSNFIDAINHKATRKTYLKYNGKIKFIWLSKKTMDEAIKYGLKNNYYIYNAVKNETKKRADVIKNKKIVTVARLAKEKRIDIMINALNEIFENKKYSMWSFEIYGDGNEYDYLKSLIKSKQIKLMGRVNDTLKVFLSSSINLNTSKNEGFCLTIIEGYECGIPSVSFNFGDPTKEVVCENITGFIAKDKNDFKKKIISLMNDNKLLDKMSFEAKEYNKKFHIENIVKEWEKLFK